MKEQQLLVWRDNLSTSSDNPSFDVEADLYGLSRLSGRGERANIFYWTTPKNCPFCGSIMSYGNNTVLDNAQIEVNQYDLLCKFCHYRSILVNELYYSALDMRMELGVENIKRQWFKRPILKRFDLNDSSIAYNELGSWIASHPKLLYALTPRRFEELVADVFKSAMGFTVRLTQESKDGGIDIFLLEKDGTQAIVQVKRNRADRKIGVDLIDQVRGLKLRPENHEITKAYIVTSSSFTKGAVQLAQNAPVITKLDMELIDCEHFLKELSCYGGGIGSLTEVIRNRLEKP